ncbi:MAG: iron ABC transporter permease [Myxococcales bacterium]|nr:iron ABC transporter permease [Myxococcales bacterium]
MRSPRGASVIAATITQLAHQSRTRRLQVGIGLGILLFAGSWLALSVGAVNLGPRGVWDALWGTSEPMMTVVVRTLRAPRLLLAVTTGAVLAMAGTALQALFRNPLADPALIGVSAGAAVGAAGATVLGPMVLAAAWAVSAAAAPLAAFAGALAAAWILWRVAAQQGRPQVARMLLAGIALNALAGALVGLALYAADNQGLRALTGWMLGSLAGSTWGVVAAPAVLSAAAIVAFWRMSPSLDALLLGDSGARQAGTDPDKLLRQVAGWVALGVGASVAVTGIIGFVGLVVPHALRLLIGPRHRALMPLSGLGGAALLVIADVGARTLLAPAELPVGVLTSLVGAPFFLVLVARSRPGSLS